MYCIPVRKVYQPQTQKQKVMGLLFAPEQIFQSRQMVCPVGVHPLQQTVARLWKMAGFEGFFSNHSLHATASTRLYLAGVNEQLIAEKTGHRSVSVRNYKRTSEDQEQCVSDIV